MGKRVDSFHKELASLKAVPTSKLHCMMRYLRTANGWTQKEVARAVGIDRSTYSYYETGKTEPKYDTLVRLSCLYEISVECLLGIQGLPDAYREENKWNVLSLL